MPERYIDFIGGEWTPAASGETLPDINPADRREILGEFPNSSTADARRAVEAAAAAQEAWAVLPAVARGEFLRRTADILEARVDTVARDLMREEGKSLPEARGETLRAVTILRYYSAHAMLPDGEVIPSAGAKTLLFTRRAPLGVCALITPWNFPIAIPVWKAAPALVFGNTVILKPSEHTPLTAWHLAQCFEEAKLPAGVFNVLFGEGARVGEALVTAREVAAVSFTGSVATGKTIAGWAAAQGKKYQLEMGGKNAAIVLPDADLDQAVTLTLSGAFKSAGEKCTATSRAIIHEAIYDRFAARLAQQAGALKIGPGDDPDAYLGPVITAQARDRILSAIAAARAEGAELLCGGNVPEGAGLEHGFYVQPTLFGDVRPEMRVAREEVFGPVLCLMRARDLDHALSLANEVEYGLSASLFTRDLNAALTFAERIQAGMVRINGETAGVEPQAPFGGMKASSSYSREQGLAARDFFTQIKTISVDLALAPQ
ncbi:MAG TPA: aldehyde dehydrogenase family protein [Chthonomonadaceae bacterium]|nr:aldehyde dehydrogenase family protein [Chthonomonadaceae bacterium]